MGEFFGSIYCWFEDFFGLELSEYMWGSSSPPITKQFLYRDWLYHVWHKPCNGVGLLLCSESPSLKQLVGLAYLFRHKCHYQLYSWLAMGAKRLL